MFRNTTKAKAGVRLPGFVVDTDWRSRLENFPAVYGPYLPLSSPSHSIFIKLNNRLMIVSIAFSDLLSR
jgi:hypothetical protein